MGKKKATKKKASEEDESGSIASATTLSSLHDLGYDDSSVIEDDPFESSIDALYEKRATTREKGLQSLVRLFTASVCYEEALVRKDTLCTLMLGCIRKGGALEATLACRGIALLLMTLGAGDDAESIQQEAQPVLEQAACYGKAATVKAAAIEALAITAFVASENPSVVDKCMTGFANLWKTGPGKASEAAIRGWALLLSTVPTQRMTSGSIESSLQSLSKLLHSSEVEVRAAAGEAIALLYHSCGLSNLDAVLESEQDELEPDSPTDSEGAIDHYNDLVTQPIPTLDAQSSAQPAIQSDTSTSQPSTANPIGGSQLENGSSLLNGGYSSPSASPDSAQHPLSASDERDRADATSTTAEASTSTRAVHVDDVPHSSELSTDNDTSTSTTSLTAVNNNTPAKGAKTGKQLPGKNPKPPSHSPAKNPRNHKQQAEAISSGLDDVVGRMKDLATNKGDSNRRSRKDRASSRSTFRELCSVVEQGGNVPQTKVKLRHGDTLTVNTLSGTVQLNAIRRFLAEGFQTHLQQNPLLHQIFEFEPRGEKADRLTALEKRLYRSPASAESKSRTQQRNHDRAAASAYKGAMMAGGW